MLSKRVAKICLHFFYLLARWRQLTQFKPLSFTDCKRLKSFSFFYASNALNAWYSTVQCKMLRKKNQEEVQCNTKGQIWLPLHRTREYCHNSSNSFPFFVCANCEGRKKIILYITQLKLRWLCQKKMSWLNT